ncbi:MAG TPA: hypothetical protein PLY68_02390 [Myxococcota bacterium]|nr:hypothetical protein [Myxococcota bacterium]HNZ02730.1 hypothetical protein [Myxococcota bacterium]HOD06913.1 hypothetical protein [Myxococcota bacterium]HQP95028.1 hypothetical protein [Myxococcota bacterium]
MALSTDVRRRNLVVLLAVTLAATYFVSTPALSNPMDQFGSGSVGIAMGGTGTATADSYSATYYNPAALGLMERVEFGLGVSVYRPWLNARFNEFDDVTKTTSPVSQRRFDRATVFLEGGVAAPIPLGKGLDRHLFFGLQVQTPATELYSVEALGPTEANFPFYEKRNTRLVVNVAMAGRWKWLMVGVGASVLPSVGGLVSVDLDSADPQNYLGITVGYRVSANVGLLFEPIRGLTLGFSWRGANRTHIELPVDATVSNSINPIYLMVNAIAYWTPHEFSFGAGWKADDYSVSADVICYLFSGYRMSSPEVKLFSDPGREDEIGSSSIPSPGLRDSVTVRLGAEYRPHKAVALRAGFGWAQSPLPVQSGETNLLGGDQFSGSFGIGFDAEHVGGPKISVDAHFMAAAVIDNTDVKISMIPGNPGYPAVGGGGWFLNSGVSLRFGF